MNAPVDAAATARLERSVRRWMSAYPRRWRVTFGEDLVGTALELAAPGQTRLTLREGLAIVRAGWALRRRERPPLRARLAFAWGVGRTVLPTRHRPWLVDQILSPWARIGAVVVVSLPWILPTVWGLVDTLADGQDDGLVLLRWATVAIWAAVPGLFVIPGFRRRAARAVWVTYFPDEPVPDMIASRRAPSSA